METSGWTKGCPVATVALDVAASNEAIREVCSTVYTDWEHTAVRTVRAQRDRRIGRDCGPRMDTDAR